MADRIIFVCIVVLTGVYFWATTQIPTLEIGDPLGPKAFPRLLGAGMIIAAVMLLLEMLKARKARKAESKPAEPTAAEPRDFGSYKIVAGVAVATGIYFVLFEPLGYAVSTCLFLLVMTTYFNKGKRWTNGLTAVFYSFGSYYAFTSLLGVNLPRGIVPF